MFDTKVATSKMTLYPLNDSIALILKKESSTKPSDFRPINLINRNQKIFSKIIVKKLQEHMSKVLSIFSRVPTYCRVFTMCKRSLEQQRGEENN
jgi:hypothetical protein